MLKPRNPQARLEVCIHCPFSVRESHFGATVCMMRRYGRNDYELISDKGKAVDMRIPDRCPLFQEHRQIAREVAEAKNYPALFWMESRNVKFT